MKRQRVLTIWVVFYWYLAIPNAILKSLDESFEYDEPQEILKRIFMSHSEVINVAVE